MEIRGGEGNHWATEALLGEFLGDWSPSTPERTWLPVQKHLPGSGGM